MYLLYLYRLQCNSKHPLSRFLIDLDFRTYPDNKALHFLHYIHVYTNQNLRALQSK